MSICSPRFQIIPDIWDNVAKLNPSNRFVVDNIHGGDVMLSSVQFNDIVYQGAATLQKLGIRHGDCVSIFSENSYRWLVIDQSIMKAGGCNAVRGASAPIEELLFIYNNSKSVGIVVESEQLLAELLNSESSKYLRSSSHSPKFVLVLFPIRRSGAEIKEYLKDTLADHTAVVTFSELIDSSHRREYRPVMRDKDATATVVYTSGTTGRPKGVVLTHANILHQVSGRSTSAHLTIT